MTASVARLCFHNLLEVGTVVASSEDADFPVANAYDWLTSDWFKPASVASAVNIDLTLTGPASADYFAIYGQDLYLRGGTIKLQWWNGTAYVDCFSAFAPADNAPRVLVFDAQTSAKWRVVITAASVFSIACIAFGLQLALPQGMYLNWTPPVLGRATKLVNSVSDGGAFLGRSVLANGVKSALELQYAPDAWVRANWPAFVRHIEEKPFFFVPNVSAYPTEAVFAWVPDGEAIPAPTHTHYGFMGASIPIQGLVE